MGHKTFKDHFKITHIVHISDDMLLIGSDYIPRIISIPLKTGRLQQNNSFPDFLKRYYPALLEATPEQIKELIDRKDVFERSIPVYTYDGLKIITKQCEALGHPNVTHDGILMYDNRFSPDKAQVIEWAKTEHQYRLESIQEQINGFKESLADAEDRLFSLSNQELTFD